MSDAFHEESRRFRVAVVPDLVYAAPGGVPLRANLYLPRDAGPALPAIIWLHGGGWRFGSRRVGPDLTRFFAERGFAMVAVDYRLSHRATFPAPVEDVKTAVRWLRAAGAAYGLDAGRIGLWGASAGGHLAALASLSPEAAFTPADTLYGSQRSRVQAVVDGYGPVDFLQMDHHRPPPGTVSDDPETLLLPRPGMRSADADSFESLLLGAPIETCPDRVRQANPLAYAGPGAPPFLILHGLSDTTIAPHQSQLLYAALAAHGNDVTLALIEGLGHGFLNRSHLDDGAARSIEVARHQPGRAGGAALREYRIAPVFPMIEAFFRRTLGVT